MKSVSKLIYGLCILLFAVGCSSKKSDPQPTNQQEEVNRLIATLVPRDLTKASIVNFIYQDLDGPGGKAPEVTSPALIANQIYDMEIKLYLVKSASTTDVTPEIVNESQEHQFFFTISSGLNLRFLYSDADTDSKPIGLKTQVNTGSSSTGTLKIILRHKLNKFASGVSSGNISNAGGDTDLETEPAFSVNIQ